MSESNRPEGPRAPVVRPVRAETTDSLTEAMPLQKEYRGHNRVVTGEEVSAWEEQVSAWSLEQTERLLYSILHYVETGEMAFDDYLPGIAALGRHMAKLGVDVSDICNPNRYPAVTRADSTLHHASRPGKPATGKE